MPTAAELIFYRDDFPSARFPHSHPIISEEKTVRSLGATNIGADDQAQGEAFKNSVIT